MIIIVKMCKIGELDILTLILSMFVLLPSGLKSIKHFYNKKFVRFAYYLLIFIVSLYVSVYKIEEIERNN